MKGEKNNKNHESQMNRSSIKPAELDADSTTALFKETQDKLDGAYYKSDVASVDDYNDDAAGDYDYSKSTTNDDAVEETYKDDYVGNDDVPAKSTKKSNKKTSRFSDKKNKKDDTSANDYYDDTADDNYYFESTTNDAAVDGRTYTDDYVGNDDVPAKSTKKSNKKTSRSSDKKNKKDTATSSKKSYQSKRDGKRETSPRKVYFP